MATIASLIEHLKDYDPNEPVIFQFIVAEHTRYDAERFEELAEVIMDSDAFGKESSNFFESWLADTDDYLGDAD